MNRSSMFRPTRRVGTHAQRWSSAAGVALLVAAVGMGIPLFASPIASVASATGSLTLSPATTALVAPSSVTTLTGLAVSGDATDQLQITVSTTAGTLAMTTQTGLTLAYGNAWSGGTSITVNGLQAALNAGLASVVLTAPASATTATISMTGMVAQSGYNYLAPNQHFYRYVVSSGISWSAADAAAQQLTFQGQQGYLATIPNATVNNFISSNIANATNVWFGLRAYESPDANATYGGTTYPRLWRWAIGSSESPIAGGIVSYCNALAATCSFTNDTGLYHAWASGEPNNSQGTEYVAVTNWSGTSGAWNDLSPTNSGSVHGYVVEFGGKSNSDSSLGSGFSGVTTTSSAVRVASAASVPAAPSVSATSGDASATLSWTPPDNGGATITGYEVSTDGGTTWNTLTTTTSSTVSNGNIVTTVSGTVTGLTNGQTYSTQVRAVNSAGAGAASQSTTLAPVTVPGTPTAPSATGGNGSASVSFTPPVSTGGSPITGYTVTSTPGGITQTCTTSPCVISGLTNGTSYTFTVHATNAVGNGAESGATAALTPATVPNAPVISSVTLGDSSASINFPAPADNGSPITGYTVTTQPGGATQPCSASPCTITGLTVGSAYTFTIHATNGVGDSAESVPSGSRTAITLPGQPTGVSATRGAGSASVSFTPPTANGGDPITGYTVTSTPGGITQTCTTSPCVITGLTNGTSYTFTVHATNTAGNSTESVATGSVTPATVPDAPVISSVTPGNGSATINFPAPVDGGDPITGYTVTSNPGGLSATCTASPCVITGLTNGTPYTFTVHATNTVGDSAESAASSSLTPRTAPGNPTGVSATRGDHSATVSFTPPTSTGGAAITGYTVTSNPGALTQTCATSPCVITGLTNGTAYTFTVHASNDGGNSTESVATGSVTPATVPAVPVISSVTPGNGSATVNFPAPAANGSPITGYTVTVQPGGATQPCTVTPCTVTGLTNGASYTFTVHATNSVGDSTESSASSTVTPVTFPGSPTGVSAVRGDRSATVSFTAPTVTGGSPITSYTVTSNPDGVTATCTTSPCVVDGLTNGTAYTFTVSAHNSAGANTQLVVSAPTTPATVPDAPAITGVSSGNGSASVAFQPPNDGGSPITSYTVYASAASATQTSADQTSGLQTHALPAQALGMPLAATNVPANSLSATCSASPCTITGLTNGTAYTFSVFATNSVGNGDPSALSPTATPATVPSAPAITSVTVANGSATVNFTAPGSNGGSTVTGYVVTAQPGDIQAICWSSPCVVSGLTSGTTYTFTVRALNSAGHSADSGASQVVTTSSASTAPLVNTGVQTAGPLLAAALLLTAGIALSVAGSIRYRRHQAR